jgi:glycosyltransferase involved in cell wall biosynthesis
MMRLGVNAIRLTRQFTGVGRYIECVLSEWSQMDLPFDEIVLYAHSPIDQTKVIFPLDRFRMEIVGSKAPDPVWEWRFLPKKVNDIDVLFCPSYTVPIAYPGRCVVTYLGPSENIIGTKEWFRSLIYDRLYRYSARRADFVFACSKSVKKRVVNVYGVPDPKVGVTFLAPSSEFRPIEDPDSLRRVRIKYAGNDVPYVLFVGKLARRHYIPNLLRAFANVHNKHKPPHKLVIAGPDYLNLNVPVLALKLGIGDAVIYHPFIEHKDLPPVYNAADVFIFPASEAEGFGIPPIEAMACGTPTITTNLGSLPEFATGAALLTESSRVEDLQSALEKLIFDEDLKQELRSKGPLRAQGITWRKTAKKTMSVLWKVANGHTF